MLHLKWYYYDVVWFAKPAIQSKYNSAITDDPTCGMT